MKKIDKYSVYAMILLFMVGASCNNSDYEPVIPPVVPGQGGTGTTGGGTGADDGDTPSFDYIISDWNGETAGDASADVVGTDDDYFHEANTFANTVTVTFNGTTASVESSNSKIVSKVSGAYVAVDMQTNSVTATEIIVKGSTDDGGLKIYGSKAVKITLQGAEITSKTGPAINNQCKKKCFVYLAAGTTNRLTDCATYGSDIYYYNASVEEDRKGCFFSEGNVIMSGTGTLVVSGKYKHGVVTDGLFVMRPGVTLVVNEAAKNALHVKGDEDEKIGVLINGGLFYANVAATAGRAIKCDLNVEVKGGKLMLNTSGNSEYDSTEKDTSSPACIKADGDVVISGGTHVLKSTGSGGKGINADGAITISGGEITVTTSGGRYTYSSSLTSSPKGVKADGNITLTGGKLNIAATGKSEGTEGLESGANLSVSNGEMYVYAYDDAINVTSAINITGGKVCAYSSNNDGIDANGTFTVSGGVLLCTGTSAPEGGIDVDSSSKFVIKGGTVVSYGGALQSTPSTSSTQCSVLYNGLTVSKGDKVCVLNSSDKPILTFDVPRSMNGATFFFSTADVVKGSAYTLCSGGTLSGYTSSWNGWYAGGTWSGGTDVTAFTPSSVVTSLGSSSQMGGGMGMH